MCQYIGWDMTGDGIGDTEYESNSVVDHILWRYPMAKVLYTSPSLQVLWMLEKHFPVFEVPKVIDEKPSMSSFHADWQELKEKYASYSPERIYGDIKKMPHLPGGGL
jgi:nitrous oxidase accessory protein NosD